MATTTFVAAPVQTQTVQVAPQALAAHPAAKFRKVFLGLGITLLTMGVLSIILGVVALSVSGPRSINIASGFWSGAWYLASGALSLATGIIPNRFNVIAGIVVSIFTSLAGFFVGCAEAFLAGTVNRYCTTSYCTRYVEIHATLAFIGFMSCILAIIHSSFCCCGQTNPPNVSTTTIFTAVQQPYGGGAVVYQPQQIPASPPGYNPERKQVV